VRIKERNEWKAAFTTHVGLYEPVVMFFGMTNSPATFQGMMNKILRDMINKGKVVAFVDDVLIGIETKKGHDELVEKVLKQLEENDLYCKDSSCGCNNPNPNLTLCQSRQRELVRVCHKLHSAITPQILAQFPRSKMRRKALKNTFRMMPKTCQSNQYLLRYQLISARH